VTYETIEEAQHALETAAHDVRADMGENALEAGWGDLVRTIGDCCPSAVALELERRNL